LDRAKGQVRWTLFHDWQTMTSTAYTTAPSTQSIVQKLETDGIAIIPGFLNPEQLRGMQRAFGNMLKRMRWSNFDGYRKTEPYRHMVEDVLMLDQGFVDAGLDPRVQATMREYVGPNYQLCEAKGWLSLPTNEDFHGWHGDAWYDQTKVTNRIPREVKLAMYLTDVRSGAFNYIRGSHRKHAPRPVKTAEVSDVPRDQIIEALGAAGTAILFDTSGIHRQSMPILEPRWACFYNYHEPDVPLQHEDIAAYRYHPLLLNAAFLGGMTDEDRRVLGFGDKTNYLPDFQAPVRHERFQSVVSRAYDAKLRVDRFSARVVGRLRRMAGVRTR
jgi:hypothetical protein